ncbi:MAG: hypothetical protein V2A74_05360 [bacterium]
MKCHIQRDDFSLAANVTQSLVNPQSSLPILSNVLVKIEKGEVLFMATDYENTVQCRVPAEVDKTGTVTVPGRTLHENRPRTPAGSRLDEPFRRPRPHRMRPEQLRTPNDARRGFPRATRH